MSRPQPAEYDPYYDKYISLVRETEVIDALARQPAELSALFDGLSDTRGAYAYAEGKWTMKESLSHVIDAERMFAYRVFRISRGDQTPIEGFEQDGYIENSHANGRSFSDMLDEFRLLRKANILFFRNLHPDDWVRTGTANQVTVSVRALAYIMAGHVNHHLNIFHSHYLSE
jgi:hypothetical protein